MNKKLVNKLLKLGLKQFRASQLKRLVAHRGEMLLTGDIEHNGLY